MKISVVIALLLAPLGAAGAGVVINEVFYNAPDDLDDLQWVELYNSDDSPVDIAGWKLDEGRIFTFPAGARIGPKEYLVATLNSERFSKAYGQSALGPFVRPLKRGDERLELRDGRGHVVDAVRYASRPPWPVSADGYSSSLERICPTAPGDAPENWAASPLPALPKPSGTPGAKNASFSEALPPVVAVTALPSFVAPGQPLEVTVEVKGNEPVAGAELLFRAVTTKAEGTEVAVPMEKRADGLFVASIPAQADETLLRYRVKATGRNGAVRFSPGENDLRPAFSAYVHARWEPAPSALAVLILGADDRARAEQQRGGFAGFGPPWGGGPPGGPPGFPPGGFGPPGGGPQGGSPNMPQGRPPNPPQGGPPNMPPGEPGQPGGMRPGEPVLRAEQPMPRPEEPMPRPGEAARRRGEPGRGPRGPGDFPPGFMGFGAPDTPRAPRGSSAFIHVDSRTGAVLLDFVNAVARTRGRGFIVHFNKDRPFDGMSAVSVLFEGNERSLLAEALSYDVYRRAGNAAPLTEFVRLWVDGQAVGYHLLLERPNKSFLKRHDIDTTGNLYKVRWFGQGIVGQHKKLTNTQSGHEDLLAIVDELAKTKGNPDEQWELIRKRFDVDQVATHFAVNMVLSHWDGFFNNHYSYHDTKRNKWLMFPWDHDFAWGLGLGMMGGDVMLFDLPLNFGMDGAVPPGGAQDAGLPGGPGRGFNPFGGGPVWWRPPGYFSGPLLANPNFRKIFLARVRTIVQEVFTEERCFPVIDAMVASLGDAAALRVRSRGNDPEFGRQVLAQSAEFAKDFVRKRREFLLAQPELQKD